MLTKLWDVKVYTLSFLWLFLWLPETFWGLRKVLYTSTEKINVRFFWPIFVSVKKKPDIYFFGKEGVFSSIFVSVKQKPDIYFFGNGLQKMKIYSLYVGGNQKPYIFFFEKNQKFLLALNKNRTFIFSEKISDFC